MFSIIKDLLVNQSLINVYLVYGNKSSSSVIFSEELNKLKQNFFERFKIYNFYSKEEFFNDDSHNYQGRIHVDFVEKFMKNIQIPT